MSEVFDFKNVITVPQETQCDLEGSDDLEDK